MSNMDIEFVDELPSRGFGTSWANRLVPLLQYPGRWARIFIAESPEQAQKCQSNLHSRQVQIPKPNAEWEFAARGCELYAIYRGRKVRRAGVR